MTFGAKQDPGGVILVGAHEIRALLGWISRQRVFQLAARADFPRPVADLAQGKVWSAGEVIEWLNRRRPARARTGKPNG